MGIIGDKIKRLRKGKGLSLMELAKTIGVSDTAILKIENGKTKSITIDLGKGLAKALDISFNELFDIEVDSSKLNEQAIQLKELAFHSLEMYESNQVLFSSMQHKEGEEDNEFENYRLQLREFKKGTYQTLINVGFCSAEDIRTFYNKINPKNK